MNQQEQTKAGKLLSLILRHQPETVGLQLDEGGWADVTELLERLQAHRQPLTPAELEEIVATNSKQRFAFNDDHSRIRASQGHSLEVDLHLAPAAPLHLLYHGTVDRFMDRILQEGLRKMSRRHVHLSRDYATAVQVAARRGKPLILEIRAAAMYRDGYVFYRSENGVWLTDAVPSSYIAAAKDSPSFKP